MALIFSARCLRAACPDAELWIDRIAGRCLVALGFRWHCRNVRLPPRDLASVKRLAALLRQ